MNRYQVIKLIAVVLLGVALFGCAPPVPGPRILSIQPQPQSPKEGEMVVFTFAYQNTSESESFGDVILQVTYDPDLIYQQAAPSPSNEDPSSRQLMWSLGTLQAKQSGSIAVYFEVARGIPTEKYQLEVNAQINSQNLQGTPSSVGASGESYIEGHPTPTSPPTGTPPPSEPPGQTPTERFEFPEEGVTVELPWQGKELKVQKLDFDPVYLDKQVEKPYTLVRPVIYLQVVEAQNPEVEVKDFDPPMLVIVKYTTDDAQKAEVPGNLVILDFNHEKDLWLPLETSINESEMTGTVSVSSFRSPMSWGRK